MTDSDLSSDPSPLTSMTPVWPHLDSPLWLIFWLQPFHWLAPFVRSIWHCLVPVGVLQYLFPENQSRRYFCSLHLKPLYTLVWSGEVGQAGPGYLIVSCIDCNQNTANWQVYNSIPRPFTPLISDTFYCFFFLLKALRSDQSLWTVHCSTVEHLTSCRLYTCKQTKIFYAWQRKLPGSRRRNSWAEKC